MISLNNCLRYTASLADNQNQSTLKRGQAYNLWLGFIYLIIYLFRERKRKLMFFKNKNTLLSYCILYLEKICFVCNSLAIMNIKRRNSREYRQYIHIYSFSENLSPYTRHLNRIYLKFSITLFQGYNMDFIHEIYLTFWLFSASRSKNLSCLTSSFNTTAFFLVINYRYNKMRKRVIECFLLRVFVICD